MQVPFSKLLTFYRKEPFELTAEYKGTDVPLSSGLIGKFNVDSVEPKEDGSSQKVKVKVRVNLHGVFAVTSANLVETREVEEEVPMEVEPPAKKEEGAASPEKAKEEADNKEEAAPPAQDSEMKEEDKKEEAAAPKTQVIDTTIAPISRLFSSYFFRCCLLTKNTSKMNIYHLPD